MPAAVGQQAIEPRDNFHASSNPGKAEWHNRWEVMLAVGLLASLAVATIVAVALPALGVSLGSVALFGQEVGRLTLVGIGAGVAGVVGTACKVNQMFHRQMLAEPPRVEEQQDVQQDSEALEAARVRGDLAGQVAEKRKALEVLERKYRGMQDQVSRRLEVLESLGYVREDDPLWLFIDTAKKHDQTIRELENSIRDYEELLHPPEIFRMETKIRQVQEEAWGSLCDQIVEALPDLSDVSLKEKEKLTTALKNGIPGHSRQEKIAIISLINNFYSTQGKQAPGMGTVGRINAIVDQWESCFQETKEASMRALLAKHRVSANRLRGGVAALKRKITQVENARAEVLDRAEEKARKPLAKLTAQIERIKAELSLFEESR